jgi:hypothetical protein
VAGRLEKPRPTRSEDISKAIVLLQLQHGFLFAVACPFRHFACPCCVHADTEAISHYTDAVLVSNYNKCGVYACGHLLLDCPQLWTLLGLEDVVNK